MVVDDLSSGHRGFVPDDVPFVEGSILDTELLVKTLREHEVTGVVHVAGFKYAGVSVERPLHTYDQNVTGTVSVLEAMAEAGVDKVVFSSSAATFGTPDVDIVTEQTATEPRVAVRRVEADRRVAAARPGEGHGSAAHVAALLQRGRLGRRPRSTTPARTTCSRS